MSTSFDLTGLADGVATDDNPTDRRVDIPPPPRPTQSERPATTIPAPAPRPAAPTRTKTATSAPRRSKTTYRVFPDQRQLLRDLADRHDLFITQTVAAAIDRYLPEIRKAPPIAPLPRRPRGPRPGEETVDYQVDVTADRAGRLKDVADKVANSDVSAVMRAVLDAAFVNAGYTLGPRPDANPEAHAI